MNFVCPSLLLSILVVYVKIWLLQWWLWRDHKDEKYVDNEFELNDLGKLKYTLGIEMARSKIGLSLNWRKYSLDLSTKARKLGHRQVAALIENNHKINIKDEKWLDDEGKNIY